MPNQQLIDYIKQAQAAGQSNDAIKAALLVAGWQQADVEEGFAAVVSSVKIGGKSKTLIVAVSLLAILFLAGGGFAYWKFVYEPKETVFQQEQQQAVVQTTAQTAPMKLSATTTESTIQEILTKARDIGPIYYETFTTIYWRYLSPDSIYATSSADFFKGDQEYSTQSTVWEKFPYLRVDLTQNFSKTSKSRDIMKGDISYYYPVTDDGEPDSNYVIADFTQEPFSLNLDRKSKFLQEIIGDIFKREDNKELVTATLETIDGKSVLVIKYDIDEVGIGSEVKTAWIWYEKGIPLKIESKRKIWSTSLGEELESGETVIEFKNFKFGGIPDEIFNVTGEEISLQPEASDLAQSYDNIREVTVRILKDQRKWSPDVIEVKLNDLVRVKIINEDPYDHGFALEAFGVNKRIFPNQETVVEFVASKIGAYGFYCSVPCGEGHNEMEGTFIVLE